MNILRDALEDVSDLSRTLKKVVTMLDMSGTALSHRALRLPGCLIFLP